MLLKSSRYELTIKSVIVADWLTLTVTLRMTYLNFIQLINLSIRGILCPVMLCLLTR